MFQKVLIANRGAIAVRIARTLRSMGVRSIAVYTEADRDSLHVEAADEAILIGSGAAQDSYLNGALILQKALSHGADAIHPGYGFLSENSVFARDCMEHGIAFIGPTPEQIEIFGQKHRARELALAAEVPCITGTPLLKTLAEAQDAAQHLGYPVMLKATAGGGGMGMRVCLDESQLNEAFDSVARLAQSNFHNAGLYLERYIPFARHVEVQIFGNSAGEIVALGERDCSIQRRNQKLIEESPAPELPQIVREAMWDAAQRLAKSVGYRNAGTVEFLYDAASHQFYFLEVNTRIQVEHGVTEETYGIDLIEWMVRESCDELASLSTLKPHANGHSIEARIYAEDPLQGFRPSIGQIDAVQFPSGLRVESWVRPGLVITTHYDPLLAKIIVHGNTRQEAVDQLAAALDNTRIYGVTTNRFYLQSILSRNDYREGVASTRSLEHFAPSEPTLEVLDGGLQTTVQDYPGRIGYWSVGVPPSGPMDDWSFRYGNQLLGNPSTASGLEMTLRGGSFRFRDNQWFCLTGADMGASLDGTPIANGHPTHARTGQVLRLGESQVGMRTYLLVKGGFDLPYTLGSVATFTLGGFGGHQGRALAVGDVLAIGTPDHSKVFDPLPMAAMPPITSQWTIAVIPGPHSTYEFLDPQYLTQLTAAQWEVHYNSSRTGVRLIGPAPLWAREDGGDAGLHPSNIHDNAYAVGTLDLTGDMPILLGPDGPSLGGFVCPVTVAQADRFKLGQLHPGDRVQFRLIELDEANAMRARQDALIEAARQSAPHAEPVVHAPSMSPLSPDYPILATSAAHTPFKLTIRLAGDRNLLVEYGDMTLDIRQRMHVHNLMQALEQHNDLPILDLTPGIRSLQIHIDPRKISLKELSHHIVDLNQRLPSLESLRVPSRIVRLPLSWDDPSTQLAIDRYQQNVRPDAPWCPSNLEFIRRINGLASIDHVQEIVFNATYLVLGLGDVYLGAPVATPIDPRHRLVTTKYNPARTWTPENAVGIGGAYLCVYGMEGPGGYQFVGRTVQMWNRFRSTDNFLPGTPWLLRFFDQIQFYPVSADELLGMRRDFIRGQFNVDITPTQFDLGQYLKFLEEIGPDAERFRTRQQAAFNEERERWRALGLAEYVSEHDPQIAAVEAPIDPGTVPVRSTMPGSLWKLLVAPDQFVHAGQPVCLLESMKMEVRIDAPEAGIVRTIFVSAGDTVHTGQLLISLEPRSDPK